MAARVLVVEDDPTMAEVLVAYLQRAGHRVEWRSNGTEALRFWPQFAPEVVVLDIMLPGMSGLEILRRRRIEQDLAPVVLLSARGEEEDRVVGFETGADDYVIKPFSPREIVLRVEALLRRTEQRRDSLPPALDLGPLRIDLAAHETWIAGQPVSLTTREFDLLTFLVRHPGQTFSKTELMRRVWGWDFGDTSTVTVHVRRLREKIEQDPSDPVLVLTVGRSGYRMVRPEDLVESAEEIDE